MNTKVIREKYLLDAVNLPMIYDFYYDLPKCMDAVYAVNDADFKKQIKESFPGTKNIKVFKKTPNPSRGNICYEFYYDLIKCMDAIRAVNDADFKKKIKESFPGSKNVKIIRKTPV